MTRREFPASVKLAAWERANGCCEDCGIKIIVGLGPEYDHDIPDDLGGEPVLANCKVLCIPCHRTKTGERDVPVIAKARRLRKAAANITPAGRQKLPGCKGSRWKHTISRGWVRREE